MAELAQKGADVDSFREENERLGTELQKCRQKLLKIETFVDVESIAYKLQTLEVKNRSLKMQNDRLMEQLFNQKKENQRIRQVEDHLHKTSKQVATLERANQLLIDKITRLSGEDRQRHSTGHRPGMLNFVEEGESEMRDLDELDLTRVSNFEPPLRARGGFFGGNTGIQVSAKKNKSLTGTAFLNRFDVLMQLNETVASPKLIEHSKLLQPKYLESIVESMSAKRLQSFFRGLLDTSCVIFEENGLRMVASPVYTSSVSSFTAHVKLQIYNERAEKLIIMSPRLDFNSGLREADEEVFASNLEIEKGHSKTVSFALEADQADLTSFFPVMLEFFLFTKSEFESTINRQRRDFDRWKKRVVFPLNLLKFLGCESGADFEVVSTLKLNEEISVNNPRLLLSDLKKLFPNLSKWTCNLQPFWDLKICTR